jgi:Zn-dependent protease with chaperone function
MQLAILTAVLAAIAAAESGGGPVAGVAWRLFVVGSATLIAPLAALVGTQRLAKIGSAEDGDDAFWRLQTAVVGLWLGTVALMLLVAQWPRIVRGNWQLAGWPLVDELAILAPVIAPLILVWAVLYRVERAAQVASYRARNIAPPPPRMASYVWLQIRHQLAMVLLPPLVVVGLIEVLLSLRIMPTNVDAAWWFILPLIGVMLVLMPIAVRRIWHTSSLTENPLREILDGVCLGRKCRVRDILIWHTDHTLANAAVVGMSRHLRYLLLTDLLVNRLNDRELAAVARHELAHLRRWHLPLRMAVLLVPVVWWLAVKHAWPTVDAPLESLLSAVGVDGKRWLVLCLPVGMLVYALLAVGRFSRFLEHDADLDACYDDQGRLDPTCADDFCSALTTLCGSGRESRLSQWLHPAVVERVRFLKTAILDLDRVASFRWRLPIAAAVIVALYVAAAAVALLG